MPEDFFILIALLLPIAAASGWLVARSQAIETPDNRDNRTPDYIKGLNYLLNEQQDEAIEVFIKTLEIESDTAETHLALGNLFRLRGEVDRAIVAVVGRSYRLATRD